MEPGPLLEDELVSDPAAKPDAGTDDQSQPFLKLRTFGEEPADGVVSRTMVSRTLVQTTPMPDLTDFAIPETAIADLTPLVSVIEAEPLPEPPPTSRVSLSRTWLAGLGALAFSAGLLTAVGARVFATPTAKVAAPVEARPAPVAVAPAPAAATPAPPPVAPAIPAVASPEAASPPQSAPAVVQPVAAASVTGNSRAAAPAEPRARGRAPRARGPARAHVRASGETGGEAAVASPEDRPAPPARRAADWVDPFAE